MKKKKDNESTKRQNQENIDHSSVFKELKARIFLDKTKDLVTVVDTNGEFLYVNAASINFFGYNPEELVGKKAFDFIHPEDREETEKTFNQWVSEEVESASFENRPLVSLL